MNPARLNPEQRVKFDHWFSKRSTLSKQRSASEAVFPMFHADASHEMLAQVGLSGAGKGKS
jgi:hypothetical protein